MNLERIARAAPAALALVVAGAAGAATPAKYPWNVPDNVRVVQRAPVDNVRTFASIGAALASISGASATNRFLVKVMPGTWTESVRLPAYVALQGSGVDTTTLASAYGSASAYTVLAGNETRLEGLTIAGEAGDTVAVEGASRVEIVRAKVAMPTRVYGRAIAAPAGARLELDGAKVVLANGTAGAGDVAIYLQDGAGLVVRRSEFAIEAPGDNVFVAILADGTPTEISDSTFDLTAPNGAIEVVDSVRTVTQLRRCTVRVAQAGTGMAFYAMSGAFELHDTTVTATGRTTAVARLYGPSLVQRSTLASEQGGIQAEGAVRILNSTIEGSSLGLDVRNGAAVRIATSQLTGGFSDPSSTLRITSCVDGNLDPIPNR